MIIESKSPLDGRRNISQDSRIIPKLGSCFSVNAVLSGMIYFLGMTVPPPQINVPYLFTMKGWWSVFCCLMDPENIWSGSSKCPKESQFFITIVSLESCIEVSRQSVFPKENSKTQIQALSFSGNSFRGKKICCYYHIYFFSHSTAFHFSLDLSKKR